MPSNYEIAASAIKGWEERYGSKDTSTVTDDLIGVLKILHGAEKAGHTLPETGREVTDYIFDAFDLNEVSFDDEPTFGLEVSTNIDPAARTSGPVVSITPAKKRREQEALAELTLAIDQRLDDEQNGGTSA